MRYLVGMGQPMDYEPPMVAPTVPTMVWGGQIRLIARALGVELDEIRETLRAARRSRTTVENVMGTFEAGTQGGAALRGAGHRRRRAGDRARAHHPHPPVGRPRLAVARRRRRRRPHRDHRGQPPHQLSLEAEEEGGNRAAGGNATAAGRLVNAIPWLRAAGPGIYDALDVPLTPATGKLAPEGTRHDRPGHPRRRLKIDPAGIEIPDGKHPIFYVWGEMVPGIGIAASTFAQSVYEHSTLGLREFEAARLRIAQINGCLFCQDWRTERDGEKVEDSFDTAVEDWRTTDAFDDRTRLAAEYAERFATRPPQPRRRVLGPHERRVHPAGDRRAVDVPRLVDRLRPPQPRPRPRQRLRPPRPLTPATARSRQASCTS